MGYEEFKHKARLKISGAGPAFAEARESNIPGTHNGPGDAYRHILGAAEMTRRFGAKAATTMLNYHEQNSNPNQPGQEKDMDENNNRIGVEIGQSCKTWDECRQEARNAIDEAHGAGGTGANNTAKWRPQSEWNGNMQSPNWPPDWSKAKSPVEQNEYGDEKYQHPSHRNDGYDRDPLNRPVSTWSESDMNSVMASKAYGQQGAPGNELAQRKVQDWHNYFYGDKPVGRDATGRMTAPKPIRPIPVGKTDGSGGPVHVDAHTREGGKVSVDSHSRSRPSY